MRQNRILRLLGHRLTVRVGLAHALSDSTAVGLYAASPTCRVRGREAAAGRAYGFLGLTAVGLGGMLGGHLAYRQASGGNHAEEVPHLVTEGRHRIGAVDEFPAGQPVRRSGDHEPVQVVREPGAEIHAQRTRPGHRPSAGLRNPDHRRPCRGTPAPPGRGRT